MKLIVIPILLLFSLSYIKNINAQWDDEIEERPPLKPIIGLRAGYDFDSEVWSAGGHVKIPVGKRFRGFQIIPSGDLFFLYDNKEWQLNLDVAINLMMFYGGAGVAYLNSDFQHMGKNESKVGTNLFVGMPLILPLRHRLPIMPFAEARWTEVNNDNLFRLVFGINILLGVPQRW